MERDIGGANRRVLVIDDNPAIHDDFRKTLGGGLVSKTALVESEAALFGEAETTAMPFSFQIDCASQIRKDSLAPAYDRLGHPESVTYDYGKTQVELPDVLLAQGELLTIRGPDAPKAQVAEAVFRLCKQSALQDGDMSGKG